MFRVRILCAVLSLAFCAVLPAQTPTFKARSQLVLVPVIVHDKSGSHIPGLKVSDFLILDNKNFEQKISVFEEVTTSARQVRPIQTPGSFTNTVEDTAEARRITVIALDTVNTPILQQASARYDILQYLLKSLTPGTPVGLIAFTRTGVHIIHDVTTDPALLLEALKKVTNRKTPQPGEMVSQVPIATGGGPGAMSEAQALQGFMDGLRDIDEYENRISAIGTQEALRAVARWLHGIPGRKSLIWVTSRVPLNTDLDNPQIADQKLFGTMQLLNDANIALYPVDARGLIGGQSGWTVPSNRGTPVRTVSPMAGRIGIEAMQQVADLTGGRAFYGTNNLAGAIDKAQQDSSQYYLLGFYVNGQETNAGWHALSVRVQHEHGEVRARKGYYAVPDTSEGPPRYENVLGAALNSPVNFTELPLTLRWTSYDSPTQTQHFRLAVAPGGLAVNQDDDNRIGFEVIAVARSSVAGRPALRFSGKVDKHLTPDMLQQAARIGFALDQEWQIPPGEYRVRFVVYDSVGAHVGSVAAPLTVR